MKAKELHGEAPEAEAAKAEPEAAPKAAEAAATAPAQS